MILASQYINRLPVFFRDVSPPPRFAEDPNIQLNPINPNVMVTVAVPTAA